MKSGTTSLYSYLRKHPEIYMPLLKEPNFFSNDEIWAQGRHWYESLFKKRKNAKVVGESSVNYTKYPLHVETPGRIASLVPDIKLIYILRSPVERMYSQYLQNYYNSLETDLFENVVFEKSLYVRASLYYSQIEQYLKYFSKENILVLLLDDLKNNPVKTVKEAYRFLGVDADYIPSNIQKKKHQTKYKKGRDTRFVRTIKKLPYYPYLSQNTPEILKFWASMFLKAEVEKPTPLSRELYNELADLVREDMLKLSAFINRKLDIWNF